MDADTVSEWWTLKQAETKTGYKVETIRRWAVDRRVRSRRISAGRREYHEVAASDVRREAAANEAAGRIPAGRTPPAPVATTVATDAPDDLRDRVASLEEIARRYRRIEEMRGEITVLQERIASEHREIEIMLQGPSVVPDAIDG